MTGKRPLWARAPDGGLECAMASTGGDRAAPETGVTHAAFELERFDWEGPDRLELFGRFVGLADVPEGDAELLVRSSDGLQRLPVVPDSVSGTLVEGEHWHAAFAWEAPPTPFDSAELVIGDVVVELPAPAARRSRFRPAKLAVRRVGTADVLPSPGPVDRLGLEAELVSAREELRDARTALERAEQDAVRAREDLQGEREHRAVDAERFREALASLRESAQEAVAAEHLAVEALRAQLDAATAAHEEGEAAARTEIENLQERVAALTAAGADAEQLRGRIRAIRDALDGEPDQP